MPDHQEVWNRLTAVFRDFFEDDALTLAPGTTAAEVEGWDSVATVELMVAIEREFGFRFRTGEMARLKDVGQLIERIEHHLAC
jgi:acyl carrier protein